MGEKKRGRRLASSRKTKGGKIEEIARKGEGPSTFPPASTEKRDSLHLLMGERRAKNGKGGVDPRGQKKALSQVPKKKPDLDRFA